MHRSFDHELGSVGVTWKGREGKGTNLQQKGLYSFRISAGIVQIKRVRAVSLLSIVQKTRNKGD